jgi:predicted DNA-binding protein (UPF0278 family)
MRRFFFHLRGGLASFETSRCRGRSPAAGRHEGNYKGMEAIAMSQLSDQEEPPQGALRHSLRVRIVAACTLREVTAKEIADHEGIPLATVNYHFRALVKAGYLRLARKEQAGGFRRHFYVAERKAMLTDEEFEQLAPEDQRKVSEAILRDLLDRCRDAVREGTLDSARGRHLSWAPLLLDGEAWRELMSELARLLERCLEIQAGARARLRRSEGDEGREEAMSATVALAGFESPAGEVGFGQMAVEGPDEDGVETLHKLLHRCREALKNGTLDARSDSHLTWVPLELDAQAWEELRKELDRLREKSFEIEGGALGRLQKGGGEAIPTTVALAGFESPS